MEDKTTGHLRLSEEDKEELFTEFVARYAELDKEEKRKAATLNTATMKDVTKYWEARTRRVDLYKDIPEEQRYLYRECDGRPYYAADGIYDAYLAIRKAIPYAVGCKRSLEGFQIAGSHPGYRRTYVLDPEKDKDEATEIGKRLIDALLGYLKEARDNAQLD